MFKKLVATLTTSTLILSMLSGCTGGSAPTQSQSSEEKKKEVTLTVLTAMAYGTERFDVLLENYKKENPHISFEVQHAPNDYSIIVKSRLNSGQIPDILAAQTGAEVASYYDYAYNFTGDPILEKFNVDALETSKDANNKIMSLPWTYESMGIIYNKKVFADAGITSLPATLDELEEVCKTLKSKGITPFSNGSKEVWVLAHIASHFIATENDNPAQTVADISESKLSFSQMNTFKNIFRLLDMMNTYGPDKPLEIDWELSENMLANGQSAMIHMGDWCEATLQKFNPDVEVGFLPVPVSDNPDQAAVLSSISWQYILHKDSEKVEEAKKFLEYMLTSEDAQDWMANTVCAVPAAKTDLEPAGMLANDAKTYINAGTAKPWNHTLWPAGYNMDMGSFLQMYMLKTMDQQQTMDEITKGWLEQLQ